MMNKKALCLSISLFALAAGGAPLAAQTYEYQFSGLGFIGSENYIYSHPNGVSADGSVVVGLSSNASDQNEAFRWTSGTGMVGLGFIDGGGGILPAKPEALMPMGLLLLGVAAMLMINMRRSAGRLRLGCFLFRVFWL